MAAFMSLSIFGVTATRGRLEKQALVSRLFRRIENWLLWDFLGAAPEAPARGSRGVTAEFAFTPDPDEGSEVAVRALNEFIRSRTGWIIAVRGDVDVRVECLPGSSSPDEPQARGYDRAAIGNGERIVPTAITERFCMGADGELSY